MLFAYLPCTEILKHLDCDTWVFLYFEYTWCPKKECSMISRNHYKSAPWNFPQKSNSNIFT